MRITGVVVSIALLGCLAAGQEQPNKRNLKASGGSQATEDSVKAGGSWLSRQQRADGGWAFDKDSEVAPTGLALLAFLGAGYTSRGNHQYTATVSNGLKYLIARQDKAGRIGGVGVKEHAIGALALTEAYWMTRDPRHKQPAQKAIVWLEAQRKPGVAWSDPLTTMWCVMAWKSAKFGGLTVDPAIAAEVLKWTESDALQPTARGSAMRVLARILLGADPRKDAAVRAAADLCLKNLPDPKAVDRLYWYFGTLGMFQIGGTHWKQWNKTMKEAIVKTVNTEGWWQPVGDPTETYGRVGETALMTMCLEVYYRYDKVFGTKNAEQDGLSDAPINEPKSNAGIGVAGGAGGAFRGRGGRRNLRASGGGRAASVNRVRVPMDTEAYDRIDENPFRAVADHDTSTFSIDVDTASYANVRRFLLKDFKLPPKDAVRIEELINYFPYDYEGPAADSEHPFAAGVTVTTCPWNTEHRLARIAIQARKMEVGARPATNLVFLLDVSGSMRSADKLPLLKSAMALLVNHLGEKDRVAIAVYAGAAGLVLPPTSCTEKEVILEAISRLNAGGSTAGGAGIELAYRVAAGSFIEGGINRVILCTDGDFNVGITDRGALTRMIEEKAKSGVFLSVLGFGKGNLKDATMEELSNRGNGNYGYVDTLSEARKVLVTEMNSTLATVAKDVKIQIFFNPAKVAGYRLIGYENRMLKKEDFADDKKDAGEIGAGHAVTALYELVPAGKQVPGRNRSEDNPFIERVVPAEKSEALFRLRLRYKPPEGDTSILMESDVADSGLGFGKADRDFQWAAAVAEFGMLLTGSKQKGGASWEAVIEIAESAKGDDPHGYRAAFVEMAKAAKRLEAVQ